MGILFHCCFIFVSIITNKAKVSLLIVFDHLAFFVHELLFYVLFFLLSYWSLFFFFTLYILI